MCALVGRYFDVIYFQPTVPAYVLNVLPAGAPEAPSGHTLPSGSVCQIKLFESSVWDFAHVTRPGHTLAQ